MKAFLALSSLALAALVAGCQAEIIQNPAIDQGDQNIVTPGSDDPGMCGDVELHVVGVYDSYDSSTKANGEAHVHIDRPGSVLLFLSAYSQTHWTVTAGPDTNLVSVVAHGYEPQSVTAPPGVSTSAESAETGSTFLGCGYEYPDKDPTSGCETPELLAAIAGHMGQPVRSFHGCYAASDFTIGADLSSSSNCAVDMGYAHTSMVATCEEPTKPTP